jgi:iron complex outermembrane recepter protein
MVLHKSLFLISSALCVTLAAIPTQAQTAPVSDEALQDSIIVTGERIARGVNETSSSVVVETAKRLEERSLDNIDGLLGQLPNIQLGSDDQGPSIRGQDTTGPLLGADAFLGGSRPRSTVQIDGRAVGFNEFIYGLSSLWDVERVEAYRTPQTTTQGRNSIAGAIFIKTFDPSFKPEARVRGLVGNYDTYQLSGMVSAPIVDDQIAARATFDWRRKKSWVRFDGPDFDFGYDERADNFSNGRIKLLIKPAAIPDFRLDIGYTHLETASPQGEVVIPPFEARTYGDVGGYWRTNIDAITGIASYGTRDAVLLTLTPSYSQSRVTRLSSPGQGNALVQTKEFTLEGIVSAKLNEKVNLLGGFYHLNTNQTEFIDLSAFLGLGNFTDKQKSLGLFGELAFKALPRLTVTGGLRYQRDRQNRVGALDIFAVDYQRSFDAFLPKAALAYEVSDQVNIGLLAQRAFNPGGTTISFNTGLRDEFEAETLWNYEAYIRAGLADGVQLNANVFYTDFKNAQRTTTTVMTNPLGETIFEASVGNVPAARSYGAEIDLDARITRRFNVRAGLGLLNTKITETPDPLDPIRGRQFARAPKLSVSAGFDWQPVDRLRLDAQLRTNGRYFSDDANTPSLRIAGSTNVDAKISYEWKGITASAYVRNAFNDFALTNLFSADFGAANDPRNYGISLEAKF